MAAAPHHQKDDLPAADGGVGQEQEQEQSQPGQMLVVYERSITREIRVLDAKVSRIQLQLNVEMEKISSCSGLLEEIIAKPQASSCSALRAELDRIHAKRDRAYLKFQRKQQKMMEMQEENDDDAAPNAPDAPVAVAVVAAAAAATASK